MTLRIFSFILFLTTAMMSCDSGPKVIKPVNSNNQSTGHTGIFSDQSSNANSDMSGAGGVAPASSDDMHTVIANEVIPAQKYIYVNVTEGEDTYWVATRKQEVTVGESYFYKGGLLKTNFESKEHNRIFDRIYLIAQMVPANHTHPDAVAIETHQPFDNPATVTTEAKIKDFQVEGSVKIKELVENKEKYAGKEVQLTGEVTKVNPNIMGRNWIHLKDGSKDEYDLVVTTDLNVPEGALVTLKGNVSLDKDFGAGYFYEIIVEGGAKVEL